MTPEEWREIEQANLEAIRIDVGAVRAEKRYRTLLLVWEDGSREIPYDDMVPIEQIIEEVRESQKKREWTR